MDHNLLNKRARHLNSTLNKFWRRWKNEYLLELREAHRYSRGIPNAPPVSVGDIVVVHSDDQPRGFWKLATVEDTVIGRDGYTRGAVLKVANKGKRPSVLHRPIQRLFPLEIGCHSGETGSQPPYQPAGRSAAPDVLRDREETRSIPAPQRPKRAAALKARDKIKA